MTHVITGGCCSDAACVDVCPVDCIHPGPNDSRFAGAEMLYIDPASCIDCGACVEVCPVGAIVPDYGLDRDDQVYREVNQAFFADRPPVKVPAVRPPVPVDVSEGPRRSLRVAIVGSGPAGCYAAEHLLADPALDVEVSVFERLPAPYGLVRYGVAPDHQATKSVTQLFQRTLRSDRVRLFLGCEVGPDLLPEELLAHHHAVVVAAGAATDRRLDIRGEDLPGSHTARELVGWYNGHPDSEAWRVDLDERVVVVGNGNVALDVARMLVMPPQELRRTDAPAAVVRVLERSEVREVVVLGRRGPAEAAFTAPELHALARLPWVDVRVQLDGAVRPATTWKERQLQDLAGRSPRGGLPRITLRFNTAPVAVLGHDRVRALRVARTEVHPGPGGRPTAFPTADVEELACGVVLRSVGYRARPIAGLPFDGERGALPHVRGRVLAAPGDPLRGFYATGWAKRGPSGVIGTNRACAAETVGALLSDFRAGLLPEPTGTPEELLDLVDLRQPGWFDAAGWSTVDRHEQLAGRAAGRPREKLTARSGFADVARRRVVPA